MATTLGLALCLSACLKPRETPPPGTLSDTAAIPPPSATAQGRPDHPTDVELVAPQHAPSPATRPTDTFSPDKLRTPPQTPVYTVRLQGQDFISLLGATIYADEHAYPCTLVPENTASQPALGRIASFRLMPQDPRQPVCRCEIQEGERETSIALYSPGRPVWLELTAETLAPMLPACLNPRESDRFMNAALGPVAGDWFDGLFAPERDVAVTMDGTVYCEEMPDRVRLTISAFSSRNDQTPSLTLRAEPDFLKTRHSLTGYAPLSRRRIELMPAAWMPLDTGRGPTPEEIARNTVWMAINLQPYGAASVLLPGMQSMLPAVRTAAVPAPATTAAPRPSPTTGALPPGVSAWECFQQMAASITGRFWGHGLLAQSMSSTLFVGEPLTPQQAGLYASLVGLAGESPIACERMYNLPDERIELLRRIIPAAPVRTVDLFAHRALPPVWNLSVTNGGGRWNVLGLFNTSDEVRQESIELADLHLGDGVEQFAVYDFWQHQLLRIVKDRFQISVPPTGCRVVSIHRLADDRPTIIGTDRHITCGGLDLHDVRWNGETLTLSGQSEVIGNDPYELLLYMPEGPAGLEITQVNCAQAQISRRTHGPLRTVTFETASSGPLNWTIAFARVSQPPQSPPPPPRNLAARQNTRGVQLSWYQPDDRVVTYRIYRNQQFLAEVDTCEYQDSTAVYQTKYEYVITALNFCGQESAFSEPLIHQTPVPASTNLTQLVPLSISQHRLPLGRDRSAAGSPLRIGGQRIYRGLGTTAPSRVVYFLGGGYELFSGAVGIDDSAAGRGSAIFRIIADGQTLFTSPVMKGGQPPLPFTTRVRGKLQLELVVTDADDGNDMDYADWANPYLRASESPSGPSEPEPTPAADPGPLNFSPLAPESQPGN